MHWGQESVNQGPSTPTNASSFDARKFFIGEPSHLPAVAPK